MQFLYIFHTCNSRQDEKWNILTGNFVIFSKSWSAGKTGFYSKSSDFEIFSHKNIKSILWTVRLTVSAPTLCIYFCLKDRIRKDLFRGGFKNPCKRHQDRVPIRDVKMSTAVFRNPTFSWENTVIRLPCFRGANPKCKYKQYIQHFCLIYVILISLFLLFSSWLALIASIDQSETNKIVTSACGRISEV